jgi:hypothetical protein
MRDLVLEVLIIVNSSQNFFKYPMGNPRLVDNLKAFETKGLIYFHEKSMSWRRCGE